MHSSNVFWVILFPSNVLSARDTVLALKKFTILQGTQTRI